MISLEVKCFLVNKIQTVTGVIYPDNSKNKLFGMSSKTLIGLTASCTELWGWAHTDY